MLLNQIADKGNPPRKHRVDLRIQVGWERSTGREGEFGRLGVFVGRMGMVVRTASTAGLGAGAQGLVDDGLDRAGATAAFGAAAETAIHLLGISCQGPAGTHGTTDIVVAEDVTGTDNHQRKAGPSVMLVIIDIVGPRRMQKEKALFEAIPN
ncbi:hypothetical protein AS156_30415 [Bradyrhizobium macuxiense]|uniref:Uncharacterized protein n=1 Tax=Bradyrhizobium macuxiense TaxID=1755647 RepID=A0A109K2R5_9BRAD|nr:hypothetical protein AS156_30415 [Bradyrhizobium macuxiense]